MERDNGTFMEWEMMEKVSAKTLRTSARMAAILASVALPLAFSSCEVKGPGFFEPTLGDRSLLADLDAPVFSGFTPQINLTGPQNVDVISFNFNDPEGSNGAIPSGVDPSTVRAILGGMNLDLTQAGHRWQGGINGFQDGPIGVELSGSDLAGNAGSIGYNFHLKRNAPLINFTLTPDASFSSEEDEVELDLQGVIADPFLGGAWAGIYDFGPDGLCGTADDQPWPQGSNPGEVSTNFFDFTGALGPNGGFAFSAQVLNPVETEGGSRLDDLCFRVWAEDTAGDGMGGSNPNTSLLTFTTSLGWTRPVTTGSIAGTVTRDGEPLGGVGVSAGVFIQTTAGDGTYRFSGLSPQPYTVGISPPDGTVCVPISKNTEVVVGFESVVDFSCTTAPGSISGTVMSGGEPLAGATVGIGGPSQQTGQNGMYRFDGLTPGPYTVAVTPPAGVVCEPASKGTQVQAGGESVVDFDCEPALGSISGTVRLDGAPLSGVTVSLGGTSQETAEDGTYRFEGLNPGPYTVSLSGLSEDVTCEPASKNTQVQPGQETVEDFACTTDEDFVLEAVGSYRHFVGFSRICLRVKTTPAQPNAAFTATATGPAGGLSGSGVQEGTLDAMGEAAVSNDILLYGLYNWSFQIGERSWNIPVNVTFSGGSCDF